MTYLQAPNLSPYSLLDVDESPRGEGLFTSEPHQLYSVEYISQFYIAFNVPINRGIPRKSSFKVYNGHANALAPAFQRFNLPASLVSSSLSVA